MNELGFALTMAATLVILFVIILAGTIEGQNTNVEIAEIYAEACAAARSPGDCIIELNQGRR